MPARGPHSRPRTTLKAGEVTVATAAKMLDMTERNVVYLIGEELLLARRGIINPERRYNHWILLESSVREYAAVTNRIIQEPFMLAQAQGRNRELSSYVMREFSAALEKLRIIKIDGAISKTGLVWITFLGPTGRKNLTNFPRQEGKRQALLGKQHFLIEVDDDGLVHVFYKMAAGESTTTMRHNFKAIIERAVEQVRANDQKLRQRRKDA